MCVCVCIAILRLLEANTNLYTLRCVARDLGGGDPERMAPPNFAKYVEETFAGTCIKVETISDRKVFEKEYPLFAAVDRAARREFYLCFQ